MKTINSLWFLSLSIWGGLTLCSAVCDDLPFVSNANADPADLITPFVNGTVVTYICHYGYHLFPNISSTATCIIDNGTSFWKLESFSCEPMCLDFPVVPNVELSPEGQTLPILSGNFVKYQCELGYSSEESAPRFFCENGTWILPQEACRPNSCGYPGDIENAHRDGNLFTFPFNVTYHCYKGYRLKGNPTIFCMPSGIWKPRPPSCEIVICPLLSQLENGKVISSDRKYNAIATYECNRSYHLEGSAVRVCQGDAAWNGSAPICVATTCLNPGPLANGRVIPPKEIYNAGDVVIFKCFYSQPGEGQHASKCLEDGTWLKRPPLCAAKTTATAIIESTTATMTLANKTTENPNTIKSSSCEDPGDIRHGNRKVTGFTPNSNVTYSCENGYELRGEKTLTCLSTGKWNLDKLPICVKPIPISTIVGIVIGILSLIILGVSGYFLYRWREQKLHGYGKKSKALTADATDLEEIAGLDKGKKPIPVTVL